jgi:hypothetical protein
VIPISGEYQVLGIDHDRFRGAARGWGWGWGHFAAAYRDREIQTVHRGPNKGKQIVTDKKPLQHVARFLKSAWNSSSAARAWSAQSREVVGGWMMLSQVE